MLAEMFTGFDWTVWISLAIILVVIGVVILLKDLQEIRTQQQCIRDKEAFWVTQQDLSQLLANNNKIMLTRIHDIVRQVNETVSRNGETPNLTIQVLQEELAQSIQSMDYVGGALGEPSKAQQQMADHVYGDAPPALVD